MGVMGAFCVQTNGEETSVVNVHESARNVYGTDAVAIVPSNVVAVIPSVPVPTATA